jgi:diaminohydroxyphosphoribosylaminopyrimidine deaminase/5-amino-6-(5-phosphoribosylamino)uracil reductase
LVAIARTEATDTSFMRAALALARRGLGRVAPNPAVGCLIVRDGGVVGRGWTQSGGRPHAETEALRRAAGNARGAAAYITLEPCAHHGATPPCVEALVAAGIARAVVAIEDPDPRVAGRGLARLREAGVEVALGSEAAAAAELNAGFLTRVRSGRPQVTLKLATSLDGRIATATGASRWITGAAARARAHGLRAAHDAIAVGIGTVLRDDPMLDCRLPGMTNRSPTRVVFDTRLRLPVASKLARSARHIPVLAITGEGQDSDALAALGVELVRAPMADGLLDPKAALSALAARGITRLLVEGGATLATAFLTAGLVDRLAWFHARKVIGGDGKAAVGDLGLDDIAGAPDLRLIDVEDLDGDILETLALPPRRRPVS